MEPWSHGSTIFWGLSCHFQNCKLEVYTTNGLKATGVLLTPPCSKPFQRACCESINPFRFIQDSSNGLTNASITISDGKIYCTFIRDSITKLVLPESASAPEVTIDLNSVDYFVLLASGPLASKDQISRHKGASVSATAIKVFIWVCLSY